MKCMYIIAIQDEETALIKASMFGKLDVVQFLIDQGASINKQGEVRITEYYVYYLWFYNTFI